MKKTITVLLFTMASFACFSQVSKKDSAMLDSVFVTIINQKFSAFGLAMSDKLTKLQWETVMAELDKQLSSAIIEWRRRKN